MPIQSIDTRRVYQQIADQLLHLIDTGEFTVESRLPSERDLAEKFKVSRPSVREALIALEVVGVVQIKMGSGVYVCKPEQAKQKGRRESKIAAKEFAPFELIQARLLIESEIASQAALCRTDQDVEQLESLLNQMIERSEKNQNPLEADREFHSVLARASGNQVLASMVEQMFDARMGVLFSRLSHYFDTSVTWNQAIKEHRAIVRAIKARDPEKARLAMRHHMERAYKRFSASWVKSNSDHKLAGNATLNLSAKATKPGKMPG